MLIDMNVTATYLEDTSANLQVPSRSSHVDKLGRTFLIIEVKWWIIIVKHLLVKKSLRKMNNAM